MNHNENDLICRWSSASPVNGSVDPPRGHDPQVENHCNLSHHMIPCLPLSCQLTVASVWQEEENPGLQF